MQFLRVHNSVLLKITRLGQHSKGDSMKSSIIYNVALNTAGVLLGTAVTILIGPPFLVWYLGKKAWSRYRKTTVV